MKKKYLVVPIALALFFFVYAGDSKLADGFEKHKVLKVSRAFINCFNRRDYAGLQKYLSAEMKNADARRIQCTIKAVSESLGNFVRIKGAGISTKTICGQPYAACTIKCQYAHQEVAFTFTIDQDSKIAAISIE